MSFDQPFQSPGVPAGPTAPGPYMGRSGTPGRFPIRAGTAQADGGVYGRPMTQPMPPRQAPPAYYPMNGPGPVPPAAAGATPSPFTAPGSYPTPMAGRTGIFGGSMPHPGDTNPNVPGGGGPAGPAGSGNGAPPTTGPRAGDPGTPATWGGGRANPLTLADQIENDRKGRGPQK